MSGPRTVLHLIDTGGPGGAETVLLNVVRGLDPRRWTSVAVAPEVNWLHEALGAAGKEPVLISNLDGPRYLLGVHRLLKRHRVDVIHAHLLGSGVYGVLAGAPLGVPVVCTFHGRADISERERLLAVKLRILARPSSRFAFVTKDLLRHVVARHPILARGARVVHNGIDADVPAPTGREREELGVPPGPALVGAIGNVRPAKDYPTLLRAAARLRDRGVDARWVVLGHGLPPDMEALRSLRHALGLDDVVAFPGFRSDARRLLHAFDVFVSSSSSEGFSLSTVEALWAGKPAVVTRSGGPEEIVRDGETGLLVTSESPEALADGVARVLEDRRLASRLGAAGETDVRERFSLRRMANAYEALYGEVLGRRSARTQARVSLANG